MFNREMLAPLFAALLGCTAVGCRQTHPARLSAVAPGPAVPRVSPLTWKILWWQTSLPLGQAGHVTVLGHLKTANTDPAKDFRFYVNYGMMNKNPKLDVLKMGREPDMTVELTSAAFDPSFIPGYQSDAPLDDDTIFKNFDTWKKQLRDDIRSKKAKWQPFGNNCANGSLRALRQTGFNVGLNPDALILHPVQVLWAVLATNKRLAPDPSVFISGVDLKAHPDDLSDIFPDFENESGRDLVDPDEVPGPYDDASDATIDAALARAADDHAAAAVIDADSPVDRQVDVNASDAAATHTTGAARAGR